MKKKNRPRGTPNDICTHEIEAGWGIWGATHKPTKNEHMGEIQLNPHKGERQQSYDN